ncbi:DNA-processing protein DprA [Chishuiella sp.]|uniref:DNA-processing protein DprA n=1 Tax=Chishuiella sp. TaxID=1969467 RepID=UPI0028A92E84|nr:DNA-processing protein DprA [Chishuiella sp.]
MNTELPYILAISFQKGIGDVIGKKIITHFGSAKKAWRSKPEELLKIKRIGKVLSNDFGSDKYLHLAYKEIEYCDKNNINIISFFDTNYPNNLKECYDCPLVIYTKGNLDFNSSNKKKIAIVGTRKMTNYGKNFINELIDNLSDFDISIISGLAYGCDIESHAVALKNNISTWAVMGTNLDKIYPSTHKKIANEMLVNGGWLTEQPSFKLTTPEAFLQRNRIIAGLSDAIVVVESAFKGGSLVTAKFANDYNREVFALPGKTIDPLNEGCNFLIKTQQAYLIENSKDIINYFNFDINRKSNQLDLFIEFSEEENSIVNLLRIDGKQHIDIISYKLDLKSYELMPILLDLELKQVISTLPGKFYALK